MGNFQICSSSLMSQQRPLSHGFKVELGDQHPENQLTYASKFPREMRVAGETFLLATVVGTTQLSGFSHALTLAFTRNGIFSLDDNDCRGPLPSDDFLINFKLVNYIKVSLLCIFLA